MIVQSPECCDSTWVLPGYSDNVFGIYVFVFVVLKEKRKPSLVAAMGRMENIRVPGWWLL